MGSCNDCYDSTASCQGALWFWDVSKTTGWTQVVHQGSLNYTVGLCNFLILVDGSLLFELHTLSLFVELSPMEILFLTQMQRFGDLVTWCFNGVLC